MVADENTKLSKQKKPEMPKGGRKGGKIFPRIALEQALAYSKRLVSKTAIAPQPEATVLAGVFDNAGSDGKIRLSALKQFGLVEGTASAYKSTRLAKDIETSADDAEKLPFIRQALLTSKIFQEVYNTYQGDQASKAKIRGRVQQLGVHPEVAENCTDVFVNSAMTASLATAENDGIRLLAATQMSGEARSLEGEEDTEGSEVDSASNQDLSAPDDGNASSSSSADKPKIPVDGGAMPRPRTAADVTVNLTVDSSLDGEKLEKQLTLLRRYGLI